MLNYFFVLFAALILRAALIRVNTVVLFVSMQIYRILGRTVVTYPKLLDETDFYMALDMSLLIDEIKVTSSAVKLQSYEYY